MVTHLPFAACNTASKLSIPLNFYIIISHFWGSQRCFNRPIESDFRFHLLLLLQIQPSAGMVVLYCYYTPYTILPGLSRHVIQSILVVCVSAT